MSKKEVVKAPVLTIKKLKSCKGTEGDAFSCNLYVDGKKAASVTQGGHGGGNDYHWNDEATEKRVYDWVGTLPPETVDFDNVHMVVMKSNLDVVIAKIIDAVEFKKKLKALCRKNIVFSLKGDDGKEQYMTINRKYDPGLKAAMIRKYGDSLGEIVNERYLPAGG